MDPDGRHESPGSESVAVTRALAFSWVISQSPFPKGNAKRSAPVGHCRHPAFYKDSKHAHPVFQKETQSLFPKAVCYTNIMEKIAQNKVTRGLCSQDLQKPTHRENDLPTHAAYFSVQSSREVYLVCKLKTPSHLEFVSLIPQWEEGPRYPHQVLYLTMLQKSREDFLRKRVQDNNPQTLTLERGLCISQGGTVCSHFKKSPGVERIAFPVFL